METKKADPFAHEEEDDKRTCDFTTLLLLSLKRKLYDKLKQGCFRLGYKPSEDLLIQKHIGKPMEGGDGSPSVEPSETSSLTDRTNSARSDVFYMCDGQWRSSDWQTLGVNTAARRQNSTTVARRRRVNVSPGKALDDNFEARVSAVSEFNVVQTFLPWLLPWILTLLTFLLIEKPSQHQLHKKRKERNLKIVRSEQYRSMHRRKNSGMKSILPAQGSSSLLLLATSLPTQDKRTSKDSARGVRSITKQCAAVAKVNRVPIRGLPQCPRLIMSPPSSPRMRTCASEEEPKSDVLSVSPKANKSSLKVDSLQPFKILSQSPKKIVIELERVEQLEGLLSKQFAQQDSKIEMTPSQEMDSDDVCCSDAPKLPERCLVKESRKTMEDMASEDTGIKDKRLNNTLRFGQSPKAKAIDILKAKKARDMELARSRESSIGTPKIHTTDREDISRETSDVEPMPDSVSSSVNEEFFIGHLETSLSSSDSYPLESDVSLSTRSSGVPAPSAQTLTLIRQNSRQIAPDLNDSFSSTMSPSDVSLSTRSSGVPAVSTQTLTLARQNSRHISPDLKDSFSSTISKWPSIDEEGSMDVEQFPVHTAPEKKIEAEREKQKQIQVERQVDTEQERQEKLDILKEMWNPQIKPSLPRKSISPFSAASQQEPEMPKPQRPIPTSVASPPDPPAKKPAYEESITEARKLPKRAPPPPPPPKSKEKKTSESAFNKPPPPSKSKGGAKGPAPPPPPPGKKRGGKGGSGIARAPTVIEMFQAVRKASKRKPSHRRHKSSKEHTDTKIQSEGSGGDAIIKELEKNSRYFAQIQSDVETHGPAIQKMIQDINSRKFESMTELNSFVKNIDTVLETFADETAVLRHFEWPQKYYTYREALALWLELKNRTDKCRHWTQGTRGISAELHKMKKYMELNIKRLDEVQRTLDAEVKKFSRNGIPWDSSVIQKVYDGTMCLLEKYMQIVYDEVGRTQSKSTLREKNVQYLTETINLTFKIHQFVGGLTESCTSLFEKIAAFTRTLNTDL